MSLISMIQGWANQLTLVFHLFRQQGWRYMLFRAKHFIKTKSGILEQQFPVAVFAVHTVSLDAFRQNPPKFFFSSPSDLKVVALPDSDLAAAAQELRNGTFTYFSSEKYRLQGEKPWFTHPLSGVCFPDVHWSRVPDFDPKFGDIKYIWEPSRFTHLYTLIRDEHHNGTSNAAFVFEQIDQWLEQNPINRGPNYKCSQEISLRILNWTFALHYYRTNPAFTDAFWRKLQNNIYWSLHHVYYHINFSRVAVRNNHAITESMTLWLGGLLFPWLPDLKKWSALGKKWLEEEIAYQCYEDGTYIQHSHNYQRVVVQLLSWGIRLGELHEDALSNNIYVRGAKMLHYLSTVMQTNGELPNYGANDGALFFPLATQNYRDYRPQLDAFARVIAKASPSKTTLEEGTWLGAPAAAVAETPNLNTEEFALGGIYTFRDNGCFAMIKCQAYRDRPSQADNLHLDLWINGENILRDQGTYLYNTDHSDRKYFFGTASHNTVMLDDYDQMTKGQRFVYYNWTSRAIAMWNGDNKFEGFIEGFKEVGIKICHLRRINFQPEAKRIIVHDQITNKPAGVTLHQLWHPNPTWLDSLAFTSVDGDGKSIGLTSEIGAYSGHYGVKIPVTDYRLSTSSDTLTTTITWQ